MLISMCCVRKGNCKQGPRSHGVQGSTDPHFFRCTVHGAWPLTFCRVHLCPICSCSYSFIHSFIHSLHCALASGAVYCNRSCLCVCDGRAGGRCPNLTTASARAHTKNAVFASLRAFFFIHSCIHLFSYCCSTHHR